MIGYTVLGGWLGSGKTTLINKVLESSFVDDQRIAVVVNDVGEINIDAALIRSRGTETIELTNGCVCCSIGGSLAITLRDLVVGDGPSHRPPDRIIVEASGVADPAKVASYGDRRVLCLDAVVVTVDCLDLVRRLGDETYGPMMRHQIDVADVLVVTKIDRAAPEQLAATLDWCRANVPETPVVEAADILGSFGAERGPTKPAPEFSLATRTWRPAEPVDLVALGERLADGVIVRAKGIVRDADGVRHLVQSTGAGDVSIVPIDLDLPDGLVLIGPAAAIDDFLAAQSRAPSDRCRTVALPGTPSRLVVDLP